MYGFAPISDFSSHFPLKWRFSVGLVKGGLAITLAARLVRSGFYFGFQLTGEAFPREPAIRLS